MNRYYIGNYFISDATKPMMTKVKRPIEWIPLETTPEGMTLLLSRDVLDWEFYDDAEIITWDNSFLKEYIHELYESMFSDEEKDAIIEKTFGKIFVLSEDEINKYLPSNEDKKAVQYFVNNNDGMIDISMEHNTYWLRADNCDCEEVPHVDALGNILYGPADQDEVGVRPAMWVDSKKAKLLTAKKGFNKWHHFWELEEFEQ